MTEVAKEIDVVRLLEPVEATVIGERRTVIIPKGSEGTVVVVEGPATKPEAYEVEFVLKALETYALATVPPDLVAVVWRAGG